tara:strand:+ start:5131 stop:10584 length:5454 start_codon:yes stop_codon:yes gene_type:complete
MRAFAAVFALFCLVVAPGVVSAQESQRRIETTEDADYFGFDLRTVQNIGLEDCKAICIGDNRCKAFTYNVKARWCFLKSDYNIINDFAGAIAGRIVTAEADEPDIGAPQSLDFVPASYLDAQRTYQEKNEARNADAKAQGAETLLSRARKAAGDGDLDTALKSYAAAAAADGERSSTWLDLARTAIDYQTGDQKLASALRSLAVSAALTAYDTSRTKSARAEALASLGTALENVEAWRPALSAYRASLKLNESPALRATYEDLRARKGFRVLDNTVDADSATPRVCVQFSENLVRGTDYASYVSVDGMTNPTVETEQKQICVDGLDHGKRYRVTLREGLPSAVDEQLEAPVTLDIYVRDRQPAARFNGNAFVLPSQGRHGIPLVTINTSSAKLSLFRVGERALTQVLERSDFLTQLDAYSRENIRDQIGAPVWEGTIEVASEQNSEVTTSVPVDEMLPEREPGVYVLTATPEGDTSENWEAKATQWFVISDIGMSTFSGADGLSVFLRSLETAEPLGNVSLTLLARNNEVLGTASTDADGRADFAAGLMRGAAGLAPAALLARQGEGDFVFLDLTRSGFDLSDRGVAGRAAPGGIDVMAWTERGIYRPGETVHLSALARDDQANALDDLPLTVILQRPDGKEDRRAISDGQALGGHALQFALPLNAMTGTWTARIFSDPDRPALTEKTFLVEDFQPDRIEFDLTAPDTQLSVSRPVTVAIDGRYLYGAPAAGLQASGTVTVSTTRELAGWPGYVFGLDDEETEARRFDVSANGPLDAEGKGEIDLAVSDLPSTSRFLTADLTVELRETGGRAVERSITVPVRSDEAKIGIKPAFDGDRTGENTTAAFSLIAVDAEGERIAMPGTEWSLVKVERNYQWYRTGSSWNYEAVDYSTEIADGTIDLATDEPARVEAPVGWGRYRLDVTGPDGEESSYVFDAGWYVEAKSTETPDGLEIALDRDTYAPGDTAKLHVASRFAGELLVTIGSDRLITSVTESIPADGATIDLPVTDDWGAGTYVTATLYRPADDADSRMPMRAIGVKWVSIDPGDHKIDVSMELPEQTRPRQPLTIPVTLAGLTPGEEAYVSVSAVDVGILNLTRHKTPDPEDWYFGQRALGLEIRDIYGRLIDGGAGAAGRLRSGGDGMEMRAEGSPPTEKLVAFFEGPVKVGPDGTAEVSFDIPQFNGTVRVNAVAWSKQAVGHAENQVIIRDPVVITASMPQFLAPGDSSRLLIELANTDGPAGAYELTASSHSDKVTVDATREIELGEGARTAITLPLEGFAPGADAVQIALVGPDGLSLNRDEPIEVRPAALPITTKSVVELSANGGSLRVDRELLQGSLLEGASVSIGVTRNADFDVASLLMALDLYPYGCAEQTTSRALPLLYLSELDTADRFDSAEIRERIEGAINRLVSYQSASGSFGLWGPGSGDLWLDAYVTDFITRAREKGFAVPEEATQLALDNLQNQLAYTTDIQDQGAGIAYALYVMARSRKASVSDLRYYADTQLMSFPTPMAQAQIGAALSLYGDQPRAAESFRTAFQRVKATAGLLQDRADYGSSLRDGAGILALVAESDPAPELVPELIGFIGSRLDERRYTSTQENAWMVLAARALEEANRKITIEVNGETKQGAWQESLTGDELLANPVTLINRGDETVDVAVTTVAAPAEPLPAGGDGFTIDRAYYTLDGEPTTISQVAQTDRFVVVLTMSEANKWPSRVVVTDLLPAGFTIDNPRIMGSADLKNMEWLGSPSAVHSEFRKDRFVAAFDRNASSDRSFTAAYVVRATTPGTYAHPAAVVEDMYRPELSARTATSVLRVIEVP